MGASDKNKTMKKIECLNKRRVNEWRYVNTPCTRAFVIRNKQIRPETSGARGPLCRTNIYIHIAACSFRLREQTHSHFSYSKLV